MVSVEAAMKKNDMAALEAIRIREMVAMGVDQVQMLPPQYRKEEFTRELPEWKTNAATQGERPSKVQEDGRHCAAARSAAG